MQLVTALLSGLVFGIGLILSGMTDPSKIQGFLNLTGAWDPSLALVMVGAITTAMGAFHFMSGRKRSLLGETMRLPTATKIDRRLVLGSVVFGIGWGLAGFCPGPAITSLAIGGGKIVIFTCAMIFGMGIFTLLERRRPSSPPSPK